MTSRDLDYAPLSRRVGLAERLRGAAGDNRTLVGMTVLSLFTLAFGFASFVAAASGELLSGGGLAVSVFFLVCLVSWVGEVRAAGKDGRLARFARSNGLELVVGVTDRVSAEARTPQLFVRARLDGRLRAGTTVQDLVDAGLDADLTELAGRCAIELSGREVTVFGSRRLDPERPGRMREAFGLADRLAEAMEVRRATARTEGPTLSGVPVPEPGSREDPEGQKLSPAAVLILTVTLLIAIPLLIAVVGSSLEDGLRGRREAAGLVVTLMIGAVAALVAGFVRLVTRRRPRNALVSRIVVWVGGIVAAVVVAVVAVTVVA